MNLTTTACDAGADGIASSLLRQVAQRRLNELPGLYAGEQACEGTGDPMTLHSPLTGLRLGDIPGASSGQVDQAVQAARRALTIWRNTPRVARAAALHRIAAALEREQSGLCSLLHLSNGKPAAEAAIDVSDAIATWRYYAELCADWDMFDSEPVPMSDGMFSAERLYVPVGVAALVLPWNFPLVTAAWKMAPALAAGCVVVVKPSEVAPLPEQALAALITRCALPPGVVNWVFGGATVGRSLVAHPGIDKVSFTGSTAVGRQVMQAATPRFTRLGLELGGKSSLIVCASADVDRAVQLAATGIFTNAGQMCSATSRVLVHHSLYATFLKHFAAAASHWRPVTVARPGEPAYGPLVNQQQQARVLAMIRQGILDGIDVMAGGDVPDEAPEGFFVEPTVLAGVSAGHPLWRDEIFGPVACVRPFGTEGEAVAAANDTEYGLAGTVISEDTDELQRIARALRAGIVWQNVPQMVFPEVGWGGFGSSGIGRELGIPGLRAYQEPQHFLRGTNCNAVTQYPD
ncbi:MAG: aldehyde dehydrogenase family protein [Hydrogenophaga sp.]|jgi:betaine-aldehyde dehydrogenase|nr:aldehyde dehydrogenase family protein [Hydrogenophaga sp.]